MRNMLWLAEGNIMWTLIFLFVAACWIGRLITAPARSAASLKRIEEELKSKR